MPSSEQRNTTKKGVARSFMPWKGGGGLGVVVCGFNWGLGFSLTRLHISRARVADGPYVEQAVQAELHALVLEQVDTGVGAGEVDNDLTLLKNGGC